MREVIINADDLGLDVGANEAFLELSKFGSIQSGSVMVPSPWFKQVCDFYKAYSKLNIGVHLTLTSEWHGYRWKPLTTSKINSGLIDSDGYFWKNRYLLRQNLKKNTAEIEFRAQIETAIHSGLDVTHLDCHMGVGLIPELVQIYIKLGYEYELPVLLPRKIDSILKIYKIEDIWLPFYKDIIDQLDKKDYPLVDDFKITPCFESRLAFLGYTNLLSSIDDGITFLSLHPNKNGLIAKIDPIKYQVRVDEYNIFRSNFNLEWMRSMGIQATSYRELRDKFRESLNKKNG